MNKKKETENIVMENITAFLFDKPIWVWWLFHLAATAALFGVFRLALYLLAIQSWVGVLVLAATGLIWGTVRYFRIKDKVREINNNNHEKKENIA
ncbi:MAG: hypothetical protein JW874_09390 [Spirochaetales bacterium]|nr:hypothetical protein [Spirochaetales bacterium]